MLFAADETYLLKADVIQNRFLRLHSNNDERACRYDSDAAAFTAWKIPIIDFHSLSQDTIHLLHSKRDVRTAIDLKSYYNHYRFLVAYLVYLDATIDSVPDPLVSTR